MTLDANKITIAIAIAAIISPVFTAIITAVINTIINNNHQKKMKLLEYEQERYNKTVLYQREILENYVASLEKAVANGSTPEIVEYSKCYGLARLYLGNNNIKKIMKSVHEAMISYDSTVNTEDVELIVSEIATLLENLK